MTRRILTLLAGLAVLATCVTSAAAQTNPAVVVESYHLDALGSVRVVTDQNGQILKNAAGVEVGRHDFLPFGEEWPAPQPTAKEKNLFTGHERDAETGLDYFGARYYRPQVGRFTTIDPLQTTAENLVDPQRWNRYWYVRNNPLKYTDPDGRAIFCASAACQEYAQRMTDLRKEFNDAHGLARVWAGVKLALAAGEFMPTPFAIAAEGEAAAKTAVYASRGAEDIVQYVGITNNVARRAAEHAVSKGIEIGALKGLEGLSRADARAVEQALIEIHRLGKDGGTLLNKINSIAKTNEKYAYALRRGYDLLKEGGYAVK